MSIQKMYNPFTKLFRRIKMYLSALLMTFATLGITLAIWIETTHPERGGMVTISAIIGIVSLIAAFIQIHREQTDDKKSRDELVTILKAIATKMGANADNIGGDKEKDITIKK